MVARIPFDLKKNCNIIVYDPNGTIY